MSEASLSPSGPTFQPVDPFGGSSLVLTTTKPTDISQLQHEVSQDLGVEASLAMAVEHLDQPVGPKNPGTVYASPEGLNRRLVQDCIDKHVPDPNFGKSPQRQNTEEIMAKLSKGKSLSQGEIDELLKVLSIRNERSS